MGHGDGLVAEGAGVFAVILHDDGVVVPTVWVSSFGAG